MVAAETILRRIRCAIGAFLMVAVFSVPALGANNENVAAALKKMITAGELRTGTDISEADAKALIAYYQTRSFKPVWSRDKGPKGKAKALFGEIRGADAHGLSSKFYGTPQISRLMKSKRPSDLARLDFLMTNALVGYGSDLINGRLSGPAKNGIGGTYNLVKPVDVSITEWIDGAAKAGNLRKFVAGLVGSDDRYVRLQTKIIEYERASQAGIWPVLKVKNGKANVAQVRQILGLSGDLSLKHMNGKSLIDKGLKSAIKKYQKRQGIANSGKLDGATIAQLSMPLKQRIKILKLNLERRRWQNRPVSKAFAYANLADNAVKLTRNDKTVALLKMENGKQFASLPVQYSKIVGLEKTKPGQLKLMFKGRKKPGTTAEDMALVVKGDADFKSIAKLVSSKRRSPLKKWLKSKDGKTYKFEKPVDLYLTYVTAWANRKGRINFRPDVFKRDKLLAKKLSFK